MKTFWKFLSLKVRVTTTLSNIHEAVQPLGVKACGNPRKEEFLKKAKRFGLVFLGFAAAGYCRFNFIKMTKNPIKTDDASYCRTNISPLLFSYCTYK